MRHIFELYPNTDHITKEKWQQFYNAITQQLGLLAKCQIIVRIDNNIVRFFVACDRDIGQLSNNIEVGVLRPVTDQELNLPKATKRESAVRYIPGGNILDMRENIAMKRGKKLDFAVFNMRYVNANTSIVNLELYFQDAANNWSVSRKLITTFPLHLLAVNFESNTHYLRKTSPKYLSLEKTLHLFEPADTGAIFSVSTFPYFPRDYYLPITNYEFDKHSFLIGATGSGKSKLIQLFIERLAKSQMGNNYRVIVIDPHDNLRHDLDEIPDTHIVNFANETAELFGSDIQTDISAATELTTSLLRSLLAGQFNARLERVLRLSLYTLFTSQTMSLDFLKRFLTELDLRNQVLEHAEGHIPDNIQRFFKTDFNEIRTSHYNEAVLPIISLVDEMQMQPTLGGHTSQSLVRLIQDNFLTVFSLNKVSMGEKVTKTVAGLLIQQIFLLAQARAFNERVILIVDEVSVVQNPALASILAEARKFNLSLILTQQYFGQVEKDLRDAIFANVYNYYTFRVSEEDAKSLVGNLNMEIPKEIIEAESSKGLKEEQIKIQMMVNLHPRECLVRISANGQVLPCFKAKTVDAHTSHGNKPKAQSSAAGPPKLKKFVEGKSTQQPKAANVQPEQSDTLKQVRKQRNQAVVRLGSLAASHHQTPQDPFMQPTVSLSEVLATQSSSRQE